MGIPAFTNVASCRVKTARPLPLIGRPNERRRFRFPAPATGNVIVGPLPGAFAANVGEGAGAGGAARTESLAIVGKTKDQVTGAEVSGAEVRCFKSRTDDRKGSLLPERWTLALLGLAETIQFNRESTRMKNLRLIRFTK
jgi:hypothetical protein